MTTRGKMHFRILLMFLCTGYVTASMKNKLKNLKFTDCFLFGAATASYQVEGAWNEDGKTESIWDRVSHLEPCIVKNCDTGDVAADSYHLYKRDVEMMRELGLDYYRFSLSWTRILPSGFANEVNELGVQYYNNLIDEMLKYQIEPMITLYHWDLPQRLQDLGGWTNPLIVDWYADYARVVFERFGDRANKFITINEPHQICSQGYGLEDFAPRLNVGGIAEYLCAKHLLLAHAKAWHIYNNEFRAKHCGKIGISVQFTWFEPLTDDPSDIEAAEDAFDFECGQYTNPIFSEQGDWPASMKRRIAENSEKQGYPRSRLPEFTEEEIQYVKGTSDFLGVNKYYTIYTYRNESITQYSPIPSLDNDLAVGLHSDPEWVQAESHWLRAVPWGLYKVMKKLTDIYNRPQIYITENGWSTSGGLDDEDRVEYYRGYLSALLLAMDEGCDVRSYTAWSLMDNFEWLAGYSEKFGLYEVDFKDPNRTRTPRKSAFVYKEIIRSRVVDYDFNPDSSVMTIDEGH